MKRLPLYDRIGCYGRFFTKREELHRYLASHPPSIIAGDLIFFISENPYNRSSHSNMERDVYQISMQEYDKYTHPNLPVWIMYEDTFDAFIAGDYLKVLPKSAEIIPTMNCCFRCKQCSYQQPKKDLGLWENNGNNSSPELNTTIENMKCFISRLVEAGVKNVIFTGGGEPLYNKETTLFGMQLAKDNGINTAIYTNGLFLTDDVIKKLVFIQPLLIRVSIYGMDATSFSRYTNSDEKNFQTVIQNVKNLIKYKISNNCISNISLSFLMHPDLFPNAGIIDSFFEYYFSESELGAISVIRFTPAVDYYTNIQHPAEFFAQIHKHLEIIANKYNNKTSIVLYAHRIKDLYKTKEYETCKASGFYIEISPNGDLYLCCEKFMCKQYIIGSILKDDIAGIYASAKRKAIIESVNQEKCSNCPTLCKPHEINKQINRLNCANQVALRSWKKELLKISKSKPYYAGKLNAFES